MFSRLNRTGALCAFLSMFTCALLYRVLPKINIETVINRGYEKQCRFNDNNSEPLTVTVIMPAEEIKARNREKVVGQLLKENVSAEDPRLINAIRDYFIDPPSELMPKMSRPLVVTPQAKAVDRILKQKKNGFYIECGALDGERSSNSIFFEQKRKWNGILIEVDPSWYRQIGGKNRKAFKMNACLSPNQYPVKMNFQESSFGTGQLVRREKKKLNSVFCFPIYSVMLAMKQMHIDYFSLDVEGFELDILETIPFDKLDITTFSVEYEHLTDSKRKTVISLMEKNGYSLNSTIKTDSTWVRDYIFVKKLYN